MLPLTPAILNWNNSCHCSSADADIQSKAKLLPPEYIPTNQLPARWSRSYPVAVQLCQPMTGVHTICASSLILTHVNLCKPIRELEASRSAGAAASDHCRLDFRPRGIYFQRTRQRNQESGWLTRRGEYFHNLRATAKFLSSSFDPKAGSFKTPSKCQSWSCKFQT